MCVSAMAEDVSLGYCDGNNVTGNLSGVEAVAIRFPSGEFPMYHGTKIIGVRIGLASNYDKGVRVFLRDRLDGSDIYSYKTSALYKGWCDVMFDDPLDYPASDLILGYEVETGVRPGISAMNGYTSPDGCLALTSGKWSDYTAQGAAPLCLQLLVAGDSYDKNDAALLTAADLITGNGAPIEITGNIRNNTNSILREVELSLDADGEVRKGTATVADILPGEIGAFTFPVEGIAGSGKYEWTLRIESVAGNPDEYAFNDSQSVNIQLVDELVRRKVLLEEFTGQDCPNCPGGKSRIEEALKNLDNVVMVAHHTGFGSDAYTASGSTMLHFFYNKGGSTYAPAMMLDRQLYSGNPGPVCNVGEPDEIRSRILERQKRPAEVAVTLKRNYNPETRALTVQAAMKRVDGMGIGANPMINILLVENGIIGFQRPNYNDFQHDEVNRLFVTEPLGDAVELSVTDSTYATYDVVVNEAWNVDNMEIVAFVSNYDPDNCNNCKVYNAESCALVGSDVITGAGIEDVAEGESKISAIYSITGVRLDSMQPGVNIIRYNDGTTRKVVVPVNR